MIINDNIAYNFKKIRKKRGLSLDKVSQLTGVSKGMLAQIEKGTSTASVTTLWKIANGLKVSFSSLMSQATNQVNFIRKKDMITENNSHYRVYNLVPFNPEKNFEVFSVELDAQSEHVSEAHQIGTEEYILVNQGEMELEIGGETFNLNKDKGISFKSDIDHIYRNKTSDLIVLTMIIYYNM